MKTARLKNTSRSRVRLAAGILATLPLLGCVTPGAGSLDRSAGHNGDFEFVRSGLPVNWVVSKYPLERGDLEASIDTTDAVSGQQSLKLVVRRYSSADRWQPFVFQVRKLETGETYDVSFWIKTAGCRVGVSIGNEGEYFLSGGPPENVKQDYAAHPPIRLVLSPEQTGDNEWRQFRFRYKMPETDDDLRFELKPLYPGTVWVDDVRIERSEATGPIGLID